MSLFRQELIQEEEQNYDRLTLAPEHSAMMEGIAKILSQYLDISHMALKGFIWRSLKQIQVDNNVTMKEISTMEPQQRGKFAIEAFGNLKVHLKKVLRSNSDDEVIDVAIDNGIEFYRSNFMNR